MSSGGISFGACARSLRMSVAGAGTPPMTMTSFTTSGPLLQRQPVIGRSKPFSQIDLAVLAEVGVALAGLRVQRDEVGADVGEDARVVAVGPVGEAARRAAARGPWPSGRGGSVSNQSVLPVAGSSATTAPTAVLM